VAKDATADYSDEEMHAALDINIPNYASAVRRLRPASTRSGLAGLVRRVRRPGAGRQAAAGMNESGNVDASRRVGVIQKYN
jgi:hypothetical protein